MICRVAESCFWLARYVERVDSLARLLAVNHGFQLDVQHHSLRGESHEGADTAQWLAILRSHSAVDAFFQRGARPLTGAAVAEFLIFDRAFPRAVLHNLDRARILLGRVVAGDPSGLSRASWNRLERLRGSVLQLDAGLVESIGLHKILTVVVDDTAALCEAIHEDYLDPRAETLLSGALGLQRVQLREQRQSA